MFKYIFLFSILISFGCTTEVDSGQSFALVEINQHASIETGEIPAPDINDDHQAVVPVFNHLEISSYYSQLVGYSLSQFSNANLTAYTIRAPPTFS